MKKDIKPNKGEIVIYQSEDGITKVDVKFEDETLWLSQQQLSVLYQSSRTNIVEHIKNIYNEGELEKNATFRDFRQVQVEGNREVARTIPYYNLDTIISLGYRIKSAIATKFRIWATERLKEYIIKGFSIDSEKLKKLGGGNYWKIQIKTIKKLGVVKEKNLMPLNLLMVQKNFTNFLLYELST